MKRLCCILLLICPGVIFSQDSKYYFTEGHSQGGLRKNAPVPVYHSDPLYIWNRLYHHLYTRNTSIQIPRFYIEGNIPSVNADLIDKNTDWPRSTALTTFFLSRYSSYEPGKEALSRDRLIGGDVPEFFMRDDSPEYLLAPERYKKLISYSETILAGESNQQMSLRARIHFQHDLWNRFDLIVRKREQIKENSKKLALTRLEELLVAMIRYVAPSSDELASLPDDLRVLAGRNERLRDLFTDNSHWQEVSLRKIDSAAQADPDLVSGTHARVQAYRKVFRIFLKPPTGKDKSCIVKEMGNSNAVSSPECIHWGRQMAFGGEAALVEQLLVIDDKGQLKTTPIVEAIQLRKSAPVRSGSDGQYSLDDLNFTVLHTSRLAQSMSTGMNVPPLSKFGAYTPVPRSFSAFTTRRGYTYEPLNLVCTSCHGSTGNSLMIASRHGIPRFEFYPPSNERMAQFVMKLKRKNVTWKALKEHWQR